MMKKQDNNEDQYCEFIILLVKQLKSMFAKISFER